MDHDIPVGPLEQCQITGSKNLFEAIDLGRQPLCDSLLDSPDQPEKFYPLSLNICPESGLGQLGYIVDGREVYHPAYPYRSGISKPLEEYQRAFADRIVKRFGPGYVVDVGSNDGTLLTGFRKSGCSILGIEPTNVAAIAQEENGVPTVQAFFTEALAKSLPRADFITATNVFAHMADLGEVMRGISAMLKPGGVFITESHYLLDVLEKTQFDTIYHEHVRTYSLRSLCKLFRQYGMEVFDVERAERYGGNIRAYVGWRGMHDVSLEVEKLLVHEVASGLFRPESWARFRQRVQKNGEAMRETLHRLRDKKVAGVSAPGRCSTLLNHYEIGPAQIPYLGELKNSLKLGKYMPGVHIPIVDNRRIIEEQPDALFLMAWHYAEPIVRRLRGEGVKGEIYAPLPEFRCLAS